MGLWIDDLPRAVEWLSQRPALRPRRHPQGGAAGYDITFLHPKSNDEFPIAGRGVLIELVQAPPEVIQAFSVSALEWWAQAAIESIAI